MPAAARLKDPIGHTSLLAMIGKVGAGLIVGMVVGAAVGLAATALVAATVGTGGIGGMIAVALVSSVMMKVSGASGFIAQATSAIGGFIDDLIPPDICGTIGQGSLNVFTNKLPAARAVAAGNDNLVLCSKHPPNPPQFLAEGSATVFINGFPAHRKGDKTTCDAKTAMGSENVFIGGAPTATRPIESETPAWLEKAGVIIGVALALCTRDWKSIPGKLACLGLGMVVSAAADAVVDTAFGKPVHAATGAKLLDGSDDTDFELPARLPLQWTRRYSSLDRRDGLFGPGWSVPVSVQLALNQGGEHPNLYIDEQGREIAFDAVEPGASQWNIAEGHRLARTLGGHYIVEGDDGLLREFGPALDDAPHTLALQSIEDRNGNALRLRYRDDGALHQLGDSAGRLYEFAYDAAHPGRLAAIRVRLHAGDEAQTLVSYRYDTQGRLAQVIDTLDRVVRRFSWHDEGAGAGLLASHTLPDGLQCFYAWQAAADHPRVSRHWTSDGQAWQARYDTVAGQTDVVDHLGRTRTWFWNERKQITRYLDALGHRWELVWNEDGLLSRCTQPNGGVWRNVYDGKGRLAEQIAPDGASRRTEWHSALMLPLSDTDELGRTVRYEYDDRQNLVAQEGPQGRDETTLDRWGQPVVQLDARGGRSQWVWNDAGQLVQHIDCSARATRYRYDHWGHLAAVTDALDQTTQYEHDALGRLISVTQPDGAEQRWEWGQATQPIGHRDALGARTRYAWNARGQLTERIDPAGGRLAWEYDRAGNLGRLVNENGQSYRFEHDAADRLTAQVGLDGQRTEYRLDAQGDPIRVIQGAGDRLPLTIELQRDIRGRLVTKRTGARGQTVTRFAWDAAGQPLSVTRLQADPDGGQERWQDQLDFAYDALGNVTLERSRGLLPEAWSAGERIEYASELRHEHDALGNRIATTLPQGRRLNYLYYGSGHLHQINLDGEPISDIERDALHREVQRSQGRLRMQLELDPMGRRTRHRSLDAKTGQALVKRYRYDLNGELTQRDDALIGHVEHAYDTRGQIVQTRQRLAPRPPGQTALRNVTALDEAFRYDPAANLMSPERAGGWAENNRIGVYQDKRYEYDRHGRLVRKLSGKRDSLRFEQLTLAYDDEHQLVEARREVRGVEQTSRYHYDALGRRIAKNDAFGTTLFVWDGMRLLQETRRNSTVTYVYEPDSHAPLARIDTPDPKVNWIALKPAQVYHFHNHVNGAPEELTDAEGRVMWRGRYASWGNLALQDYPQEAPDPTGLGQRPLPQQLRLQGQYADNETGLHYNTFRYYDPDIGRFVCQDPIGLDGGLNLYQYAPNPSSWVDPWGLCVSQFSGKRGRAKAAHDLKQNGFTVVAEEVTMKVNGKRVRVDFVAKDSRGNIHAFEAKHGSGGLTRNQRGSGVFDMKSPSNTAQGIGGGTITPSAGKTGSYTISTKGAPGAVLGGNGATGNATFHILKY